MTNTLGTLGLAQKAGKIIYGVKNIEYGYSKIAGLILSQDAGSGVKHTAERLAEKGIPCVTVPFSKTDIGAAVGKGLCAVAGITDKNLFTAITRSY